jgi:hypothetical protein
LKRCWLLLLLLRLLLLPPMRGQLVLPSRCHVPLLLAKLLSVVLVLVVAPVSSAP